MSMLAESRRRKTYVLTPKGKPLFDVDESRYGNKMLQKMGWSKGKGLGAKESGDTDFVRLNFKSGSGGLGYESRDDNWTQHEDGFNGLLQSLNSAAGEEGEVNRKEEDEEESFQTVGFGFKSAKGEDKIKTKVALSGESLEEKSKKSKVRVHYKKFTKGKDISQYSEKDLANIFGKKALEFDQENETGRLLEDKSTSNADYFKQNTKKLKGNQNGFSSNLEHAVATISIKGDQEQSSSAISISDYFKRKMEERKARQKEIKVEGMDKEIEGTAETNKQMEDVHGDESIRKKRKKDKKSSTKEPLLETEELSEFYFPVGEENRKKRRKFEVKKSCETGSESSSTINKTGIVENPRQNQNEEIVAPVAIKKSKKNKSTHESNSNDVEDNSKAILMSHSPHNLDLDVPIEIIEKRPTKTTEQSVDDFKVYTISAYAGEKFRNFDFTCFKGSNLAQVNGYSFDNDMKLKMTKISTADEKRIMQLWSGTKSKYSESRPKKAYKVPSLESTTTANPTKLKGIKRSFIRSKHKRRSAFKMSL